MTLQIADKVRILNKVREICEFEIDRAYQDLEEVTNRVDYFDTDILGALEKIEFYRERIESTDRELIYQTVIPNPDPVKNVLDGTADVPDYANPYFVWTNKDKYF